MLTIFATTMNAQNYSQNKLKYNYQQYVPQYDDVYNPAACGVFSFLVPGLGQMQCNETGRGFTFLGVYAGCEVITFIGYNSILSSYYNGNISGGGTGASMAILGLIGMATVNIWSIVDAVHVAQVNNMYLRDRKKTSGLNLEVAPYVAQYNINNQIVTPVGMTMRVKF